MSTRRGPLFWGLFLLLLGGIPLLVRGDVLDDAVFADAWRLWPLILVAVGLAILLGHRRGGAAITVDPGARPGDDRWRGARVGECLARERRGLRGDPRPDGAHDAGRHPWDACRCPARDGLRRTARDVLNDVVLVADRRSPRRAADRDGHRIERAHRRAGPGGRAPSGVDARAPCGLDARRRHDGQRCGRDIRPSRHDPRSIPGRGQRR